MTTLHLGIDLGATNIKWAVVARDGETWTTRATGQVLTVGDEGAEAIVDRMADIGRRAKAEHGVRTIGVGVPGLYDAARGVTLLLTNLPGGWIEQPVAEPLGRALGLRVALINDARAFGLAELRLGAGRGAATMIGLTLGTGVGGVVAVGGAVHQGHDGTAGEVGHQTLEPDGPECTCGNRGCLEAYVRADRVAAACGTDTAAAAVAAARAGDRRALDGFAEIGAWLGIGIANLVVVLTPDRVVLGGGVAGAGDLLLDPIRAELRRRVHVTALDRVELCLAELGTGAGAIGAAVHGAEVDPT
jgi:glucokinase